MKPSTLSALSAVTKSRGYEPRRWKLTGAGGPYEVTDYGEQIGIQVTRGGFTVWTGFRKGGKVTTDASALSAEDRAAVVEGLLRQDPDRKEQGGLFGESKILAEKAKKAPPAPRAVQVNLFGGTVKSASPDLFAGLGPLFGGGRGR